MVKSEVIKALGLIKAAYHTKFPYPYGNDDKDSEFEEGWLLFLADYSYETVMMAIKEFVPRNPVWPPTVGQIVQELEKAVQPEHDRLTADEAWREVQDVMRSNFYWAHAQRLENAFPENIRRAVRAVGGLAALSNTSVDDPFPRKRFMEAYNDINERIANEPGPDLIEGAKRDVKRLPGSGSIGDLLTGGDHE